MRKFITYVFGTLVLASGSVLADTGTQEDCIFTGRVNDIAREGSEGQVRVTFHSVKQGSDAPCRAAQGRSRARVQFKADPEDNLQSLSDGSKVKYRYQRKEGQDKWQLLDSQEI